MSTSSDSPRSAAAPRARDLGAGGPAPLVALDQVRFAYPSSRFRLDIPAFAVAPGESLALTGPSGCGKTTLVNLISGILVPQSGVVAFEGRPISSLPDHRRRDFRIRSIGHLFQDFGLLDYLDGEENILLPYFVNRSLVLDADARRRARDLAAQLGVADRLDRLPSRLSQGERQRIALCRALVTRPRLIIADEPTGNLDPANAERTVALLLDAVRLTGAALIAITHDRALPAHFSRTVALPDLAPPGPG